MADIHGTFSFSLDITVNNTIITASAIEVQLTKNNGATYQLLESRPIAIDATLNTVETFLYSESLPSATDANEYYVRWRAVGQSGFATSAWSANQYVGVV